MTRIETIADFIRGSYWMHAAGQGEAYFDWQDMPQQTKDFWIAVATTFENRLIRNGSYVGNLNEISNVSN